MPLGHSGHAGTASHASKAALTDQKTQGAVLLGKPASVIPGSSVRRGTSGRALYALIETQLNSNLLDIRKFDTWLPYNIHKYLATFRVPPLQGLPIGWSCAWLSWAWKVSLFHHCRPHLGRKPRGYRFGALGEQGGRRAPRRGVVRR